MDDVAPTGSGGTGDVRCCGHDDEERAGPAVRRARDHDSADGAADADLPRRGERAADLVRGAAGPPAAMPAAASLSLAATRLAPQVTSNRNWPARAERPHPPPTP